MLSTFSVNQHCITVKYYINMIKRGGIIMSMWTHAEFLLGRKSRCIHNIHNYFYIFFLSKSITVRLKKFNKKKKNS